MKATEIVNLVFLLLVFGYTVFYFRNEVILAQAQKEYELEFLRHHRKIILGQQQNKNEAIPLGFPRRISDNLTYLCLQYRSKLSPLHYVDTLLLKNNRPSRQFQYIRLRRAAVGMTLRPVPAEVVRCCEKYALIDATDVGDERIFGYLLQKDDSFDHSENVAVFYIVAKFQYQVEGRLLGPNRLPIVHYPTLPPTQSSSSNWSSRKLY